MPAAALAARCLLVSCSSGLNQKLALTHNLLLALRAFEPDVEIETDYIDVGGRTPLGAGVLAIWIAEGDVDAGEFFILQDVADHVRDADVGADRELAYTIGVFVAMGILPEIVL